MPDPVPSVHAIGDSGHVNDHNLIRQVLVDYEASLGAPNGIATLDSSGLVPVSQLPVSVINITQAGVGAPTMGQGVNGDYYQDMASGNIWGPKASGAWPGSPLGAVDIHTTQFISSGPHTAVLGETTVCTAGSFTVTLPTPTLNMRVKVVNIGTGSITVAPASATLYSLTSTTGNQTLTQGQTATYSSDGTNTYRIG